MSKGAPKIPTMLLLVLFALIIGIILAVKIDRSTDTGTLEKVKEKHMQERELYELDPGDPSSW